MMEHKKCPYCKRKNEGTVGRSIVFCCGGKKGEYYQCEKCKAEWREVTEEIVISRQRLPTTNTKEVPK